MLLGRLFEQLFAAGVTLVATSNTLPDELYRDGLNRQLFLPFIAAAQIAGRDRAARRADRLPAAQIRGRGGLPVRHRPRGRCGDGPAVAAAHRRRRRPCPRRCIRWAATSRCRSPPWARRASVRRALRSPARARATILRLAHAYDTLMIDDVPQFGRTKSDAAKRFILLIDTLYDRGIKLAASFAVPLDQLGRDVAQRRPSSSAPRPASSRCSRPPIWRSAPGSEAARSPAQSADLSTSDARGSIGARNFQHRRGFGAHGAQEDRSDRCGTDRRHAGASGSDERTGRCGPVRHRRRHAAGQGARSQPVRSGRRLQRHHQGHVRIQGHRRRRCGDRHRRRAAQARHEPRRPARNQPQGDGAGGRGHRQIRARRVRHLHHQPARRDGVGAAEVLGPAVEQGRRHGRRARLARASATSSPTSSRSRSRTSPPSCSAAMATPWCRWPATRPSPASRSPISSRWAGCSKDKLEAIIQRTRDGGAEIVGPAEDRLGLSTRRPPRPSRWPRAISRTRSASSPPPPILKGEYGVKGTYVGVPVVIGAGGAERVVEISLNWRRAEGVRQVGGRRRRPDRSLQEDRAQARLIGLP